MSEPEIRIGGGVPAPQALPMEPPAAAAPATKALMSPLRAVLLLSVSALGAVVLIFAVYQAFFAGPSFEDIKATCAPTSPYARVGDGGDTLTLHSAGKKDPGIDVQQLACFVNELEMTDAVRGELGETRALDGRQSADWGDYHATWAYHPDSGLNMIVTVR